MNNSEPLWTEQDKLDEILRRLNTAPESPQGDMLYIPIIDLRVLNNMARNGVIEYGCVDKPYHTVLVSGLNIYMKIPDTLKLSFENTSGWAGPFFQRQDGPR